MQKVILIKSDICSRDLSQALHTACLTNGIQLDGIIAEAMREGMMGVQYIPTLVGFWRATDTDPWKLVHEAPTAELVGTFTSDFNIKIGELEG